MNHNYLLLKNLYSSASGKYLKFKVRLDKAVQSGRFYKLNKRKQSSLVSRLKKLYERLKSLQTQLRLAGAGVGIALTLAISNPTQAQSSLGPFVNNDAANPLPPPFSIDQPRLAVVDIDNDGDLDVFAGTGNGGIEFFRNTAGPTAVRRFTKVTGSANPLGSVNKGLDAAPAFADVDNDGDFDMLLGVNNPSYDPPGGPPQFDYSPTFFFRNTGTVTNPVFSEQTGAGNPFDGIYAPKYGPGIPVFVDIDGDSDQDLFIGGSYSFDPYGQNNAVEFYENTAGNFAPSSHNLTGYLWNFNHAAITFADLDLNGDLDVIVSDGFGSLRCFVECSSEFCEQIGPWNSVTRTGNPMNASYFYFGSPILADFDGDGDLDLVVGQASSNSPSVQYYENADGAYTFKNKTDLNISPLGGVDVGEEAAPTFVDLDNDGDLDAVLGAKYNFGSLNPEIFVYIQGSNGEFVADPTHPLRNSTLSYHQDVIPVFVDIDGDMDQDFFYCYNSEIKFLKNNNGVFESQPTLFPTLNYGNARELSLAFADVDNDGDFDALMGNDRYSPSTILYFQNTGTASAPVFTSATPPAPFNTPIIGDTPNLVAIDLDNDGDTDISLSETYGGENTHVRFFENNGNGTFTEALSPIIAAGSPPFGFTSFADIDGDGDLDGFHGNGDYGLNGQVSYFENTNPPSVTNVNATTLNAVGGTPSVVDPALTLTDSDSDFIVRALVSIQNFQTGNEGLTFTPQAGITGLFDTNTGILTFTGQATVAAYQTLLRSVTYNFTGTVPGGRKSESGRTQDITRAISFEVFDTDFTTPLTNTRSVDVSAPNQPPVITPNLLSANGNSITLNVLTIISDPDANFIPVAGAVSITQQPTSGAVASLVFVSGSEVNLVIDYTGINFTGLDQLQIEACDDQGACTVSTINIDAVAPNQPPIITPDLLTAPGNIVTLNVLTIISDPDANFVPVAGAVNIVQQPTSGAVASLVFVSGSVINLEVDYTGISFTGLDQLQIEACDDQGACTLSTINIQVDVSAEIIVYNAFSPNNDDNTNPFFKIEYIETVSPENKVTILNRWGDVVFEVAGYNNTTKKFEGISDNGKELPSGTYFYKIEITGQTLTGYLSLRR